jgi:hypothetical protein
MNTEVEVSQNLNNEDLRQVLHLLASSFPMAYSEGLKYFQFFIEKCPDKFYLLVRDNDNSILGISCVLRRKICYDGQILDVAGLSYFAVMQDHRNFMVSTKIKEALFSFVSSKSDIFLGFARKVLDNYWYPYGFLGFTNFSNLLIEIKDGFAASQILKLSIVENNDVEAIKSLFNKTYAASPNMMIRTDEDWRYIFDKLLQKGHNLFAIKTFDGNLVGYLYRTGNIIEEICVEKKFMNRVLSLIFSVVKSEMPYAKDINFQIGITHPFSKYIRNRLHHSINTRFAWKGGHIIRISDLSKIFSKILYVIRDRLLFASVGDFRLVYCGVSFKFYCCVLSIQVEKPVQVSDNEQRLRWQKLIFGVQDVRDCLGDSEAEMKMLPFLQIMFPMRHPQIPTLDQF